MFRKGSYKLPPTTISDKLVSQEARRSKALEEQKRRRAQRIDSTRQLDLFAGLNLGGESDNEEHDEEELLRDEHAVNVTPASVAPYVSMLDPGITPNAISSFQHVTFPPPIDPQTPQQDTKKKTKRKNKKRSTKPSKWADKCMYAELLEMSSDSPWCSPDGTVNDGLPNDLETAWVAVAPVPVGKRCLAVTHQSSGVAGVVPNTTLRSRLLGKTLINRFPSTLPPLTILDCILDANWRDNGILHVLDVVKWKGQDVGDCEAPFRFWWRDTRLAELSQTLPPTINFLVNSTSPTQPNVVSNSRPRYYFPYPTNFIPIPYHTNTSLHLLDTHIIPFARELRVITVDVPISNPEPVSHPSQTGQSFLSSEFTFQAPGSQAAPHWNLNLHTNTMTPQPHPALQVAPVEASVQPDGLLLYVSEASFEPGTSPLSSWIPITGYGEDLGKGKGDLDLEDEERVDVNMGDKSSSGKEGPLDLFQQLVRRRLDRISFVRHQGPLSGADVDMDS
ncbi:hypothetical protein BYT27DRAFT_7235865 [Phlegmacium glaucopus]|nr:hypothetical protein BYT27DRAFT_7235865 [Phlegmacium glaucopus]